MSNKHIFDYLDYYVDMPRPPHYAVMLTGPWGIGKSHNVKLYLQTLKQRGKKVAYVSLYGIRSSDDIAIAILTALAPKQDSVVVKLGGQLGRALWKRLPFSEAAASVAGLITDSWCDLIVLDDLERAILPPTEVLGFVNAFIEHEERRVVIIANEKEVPDQETHRRIREKVIGMTFELVEQSDEALEHFIASTEDEATRTFFRAAADTILAIFAQSQSQNLRVLDQSLRSWERVYRVIAPALKKKDKGILAAFKLFLALSLEMRAGRIRREDFTDRVDRIVTGSMSKREGKGGEGTPLSEAQERHERIYLHDGILSDEVLTQVLCDGRIDPDAINASLSIDARFVEPDEELNWRKVWHGFLRDEREFEQAFEALEKDFVDRAHEDPGVVLHVMGMRLWGVQIGQLAQSENQIVIECKAYIDDLRQAGTLVRYRPDGFRDAAYGLAFHCHETPAFQELMKYYVEQAEFAYQDTWPLLAQNLLPDMAGDGERFYERICWSARGAKPDCADDPILSKIAPAAFVKKFLSCTPEAQRTILEGLKARYQAGRMSQQLAAECPWIIEVNDEIERRIPGLAPIRRYSLSHDTARLLGPALRDARVATATS